MSGALVGGVVGAVIGSSFGSPQLGWMVGSTLGSLVDSRSKSGPGMVDLRPQASEYGRPIPIIYSIMAVGGNVISASDLVQTGASGGKGGSPQTDGPTYVANFAILIGESDGDLDLGRIWAGPDKRLVRDTVGASVESGTLRFYDGNEDQLPDPYLESLFGAGNVPAYRGYAYIVWENFDVSSHDGNRIPFLTIEVGRKGGEAPPSLGTVWFNAMIDGGANWIIAYHGSFYGLLVYSKATMSLVHNWPVDENYVPQQSIVYDAVHGNVLITNRNLTSATSPDGVYFTINLAVGALTWHAPFTPASGETLKGVVLSGSEYVFVFALSGGGSKLYYVNTGTHTLSATQTIDSGGSAASWVYTGPSGGIAWAVLANGNVARYDLDHTTTSSITVGTMPTNFAGSTDGAVDPNSGHLWLASRAAGTFYYGCYDSTTTVGSGSMADPFFGTADQPWCFIPSSPNQAWYCGEVWLARDQFVGFNSDAGVPLTGEAQTGVYHGTNRLNDVMWNDVTSQVQALRFNGFYANGEDSPPTLPYITAALGGSDSTLQYQTLAEVVTDLSERAGLSADQIDVSQLTDQVDGYIIANQVAVRDAISQLMAAYFFDAVEDQGKIKFIKRGGDIAVEIPDDDLGAHDSSEDHSDLYETTRIMDEELPSTMSVNYVLAATKYSQASKYARRLVGYSGDEQRIDLAMVMTDEKALQVAQVNLHDPWISRVTRKLSLGYKYAYLMPTDLIGVAGNTMRITEMTQKGAYFELQCVRDDSDTYVPNVIVAETPPPDETITPPSLTLLELLNIDMLRDADDDAGFYAAACAADPNATGWAGCTVYVSVDGGANWTVAFTVTGEATMGNTTDVLSDFPGGNIVDELSHVNVSMHNGSLSSTSNAGLLSGVNMAVIGDEILFFRDATLETNGTYTLRGFLRGRRGSEYAMSGHAIGDRFVLVDPAKFVRVTQATADIGIAKQWKAVTNGMTLATANAQDFTNEGTGLKPYAPVHLGGGRDASNNATLTWTRRSRISGEWRSGVDVPLGEASEAYEVEIYSSSSYTTRLRAITGLTSPTASYSASSQTSDGITPGNPIYFRVYMLSATVGRGHSADGSI
jgi:hypothetical protein